MARKKVQQTEDTLDPDRIFKGGRGIKWPTEELRLEARRASFRRYVNKDRAKTNIYQRELRAKTLKSWVDKGIIPAVTKCEICSKTIYFIEGNQNNSIFFDHRHEDNSTIKGSPKGWIEQNNPTEEKILKFKNNDFGYLCHKCNYRLPTIGREEFLRNAIKYVFGKNKEITDGKT